MNRGSPVMDVRSIYANDEEIRNLKRKVEELDDKKAVIKEQMEIESAASSVRKKPRILVETLTREVEELIGKMLPQTLLIEERDAKGVKFFERKLTGEVIHRNIKLIWDCLKENHVCKLGIYGMGGVGKTTIMMHIHNRLLNDATFDGVVFITVSKDFSIYKLQSDIGEALKCGIKEHLERKKNCVLILDDVWEHLDLEELGIPIRAHGFEFILTTRSFDVCCQMQYQEKIKIKPLSQEEAESLFLEELGPEMPLNLEIEAIVKSIVKECAGLPIGVITMARSMRGVTEVFEWRDSLVLRILKFSYDCLGNSNVQQCFLSYALYPNDGLIGGLSTSNEQYDRGLTILNKMRNVCLLEGQHKRGMWMKMHDLIRDMALHIMGVTFIVKARKQLMRIPSEEYWTDALEKVSLMNNNIKDFPLDMSPNCPNLSTLLLKNGLSHDAVIPDSFFKNLCGLKVLDLSGNDMTKLPNSISNLVNLRALLLRHCQELRRVPYLGKLTSLRKLGAEYCRSLEVLEGLEKLVNLRYLNLTGTHIERLPKGMLDHLLHLQYLKFSVVNEEDITKLGALKTFGCYLKNVDDFNKCVKAIEHSNNPRYYDLKVDREKPEFIAKMEEIIEGRPPYLPVEGISLESLTVIDCGNMRKLLPHEWLLHLRKLRKIMVSSCNGMPSSISPPKLEWLGLLNLPQLKSICEVPISCDSMKNLTVYGCQELKRIPLQLRLCEIEELPHIWVEDEEKWKTLIWDHPNAQATLKPYLLKGNHTNRESPLFWEGPSPPSAIG
ncbi:hypothetical protein EUGRSUZ_F00954 [Eucalyptus grandis]|uniref:Uncharacterized protein n=2 Tax=Eucalyptus grandis TaxID=71139 RepID=A0ACC3KD16_EUCGR|nr:hypothetical protein EUGRSUZ_F00954 [Eucalyptus grandis]